MYKRAARADPRKRSQRGTGGRTASQALGAQATARSGPTRPPMPSPGLGGGCLRSPGAAQAPRCPGDLSLPGARNKMVGHKPSGFGSLLSGARKPWAGIAAASLAFEAGRHGEAYPDRCRTSGAQRRRRSSREEEKKEGQEEGKRGARRRGGGGAKREERGNTGCLPLKWRRPQQ